MSSLYMFTTSKAVHSRYLIHHNCTFTNKNTVTLQSVRINQVSRECWRIVGYGGVLLQSKIHFISVDKLKDYSVTCYTKARPVITVHRNSRLIVQHNHDKRILIFLAKNMSIEDICSIYSAYKLGGVFVKWVSLIEKYFIELDVCILLDRAKSGSSSYKESNLWNLLTLFTCIEKKY